MWLRAHAVPRSFSSRRPFSPPFFFCSRSASVDSSLDRMFQGVTFPHHAAVSPARPLTASESNPIILCVSAIKGDMFGVVGPPPAGLHPLSRSALCVVCAVAETLQARLFFDRLAVWKSLSIKTSEFDFVFLRVYNFTGIISQRRKRMRTYPRQVGALSQNELEMAAKQAQSDRTISSDRLHVARDGRHEAIVLRSAR